MLPIPRPMPGAELDTSPKPTKQQRRESKTAEQIIAVANDQGIIGYVHGGGNCDWPGIQNAIEVGWIKWLRDIAPPPDQPDRKRSWYELTDAGRAKLKELTS